MCPCPEDCWQGLLYSLPQASDLSSWWVDGKDVCATCVCESYWSIKLHASLEVGQNAWACHAALVFAPETQLVVVRTCVATIDLSDDVAFRLISSGQFVALDIAGILAKRLDQTVPVTALISVGFNVVFAYCRSHGQETEDGEKGFAD